MREKLSQNQRLVTAFIYLIAIMLTFNTLGSGLSSILDQNNDSSIWFYSGILLIIMGKYVTEPYFSTPTDTFANSISLILVLITIDDKTKLWGYHFLLIYSISLIVLSLIHMIFKNINEKFKNITYFLLKNIGSSTIIFSLVYLFSSYSYFTSDIFLKTHSICMFISAITLWICIVFFDIVGKIISKIVTLFTLFKNKNPQEFIGISIKSDNENRYTVEIEKNSKNINEYKNSNCRLVVIKTDSDSYCIGIIVKCRFLLDKLWLDILLLHADNQPIKINKQNLSLVGMDILFDEQIGSTRILNVDSIEDSIKSKIEQSYEYNNCENFIGFILPDSNINIIRFSLLNNSSSKIKDGAIICTKIFNYNVLYQVINGTTKEESINSSSDFGYINGIARKLGVYNYQNNELSVVKWIPNMGESVYLCDTNDASDLRELAKTAVGRLPGTDMKIPLANINSLITHNTAILGILGVGKSCLTFEIIKKIVDAGIKVICIDITNQYSSTKGLSKYIDNKLIINEFCQTYLDNWKTTAETTGAKDKPNEWGNLLNYSSKIKYGISCFLSKPDSNVLIINPDNHVVKKAASSFNIAALSDVSLVEKTKIISENLLEACMELGQTDTARCCIVFEEAHSLTPEWNSVVNSGDEKHSNGTSKVILQGRKYGLGCILITQRTANVTKSILNQCNTIFALRVFDDTGKTFLENYIGKDYSDTLPTLEERHAIAIGKGIGLKQPVILQLNDTKYIQSENLESN